MPQSRLDAPIGPEAYVEEYFLTECDGHEEYLSGPEIQLPSRLHALWGFSNIQEGMRIFDVGCGRGEILVHCGMQGISAIGMDYSNAALSLTQHAIARVEEQGIDDQWERPVIICGNAKEIPLLSQTVDRVVMSDIVEHLYPDELDKTFHEVYRVLVPGGKLFIHTMPNLWYYRYGYPLFRFVQKLRGVFLPADPRERFRYSHVHVNEQTPLKLHRSLSRVGFSSWRVWLHDYRDYNEYNPKIRWFMRWLTRIPVLKLIFCDDIFACARR
ncbi:MAG: methyltransferase domain-containing protein [Anaerolineae bacterium]